MPPAAADGIRGLSSWFAWSTGEPGGSALVGERQRVVEVGLAQHPLDGLKVIAGLARDAQLVTLDLALDALGALVADQLVDLLRVLLGDALLEGRVEVVLLAGDAGSGLRHVEVLEADLALDEVGLHDVEHCETTLLGVRLHLDDVTGEVDRSADVLEVVARRDLLARAVDRVRDLLLVELADDVEGGVGHRWVLPDACGWAVGRVAVGTRTCRTRRRGPDYGPRPISCYPSRRTKAGCPSGQWKRTVNPSRKLRRFESFTCHPVPRRASDQRKRRSGALLASPERALGHDPRFQRPAHAGLDPRKRAAVR